MPEQVQDFYPTPSTISTCMYYTGLDPRTMKEVYVPKNPHEKAMQRALIQYKNPDNYDLVKEALIMVGRKDLIGFDEKCLIPPRKIVHKYSSPKGGKNYFKQCSAKRGENKCQDNKKRDNFKQRSDNKKMSDNRKTSSSRNNKKGRR